MGKKRSAEEREDHIQRKIRKLQKKLEKNQKKKQRRRIIISDSESDTGQNDSTNHSDALPPAPPVLPSPPVPPAPPTQPAPQAPPVSAAPLDHLAPPAPTTSSAVDTGGASSGSPEDPKEQNDEELGEDIFLLLGDAPKEYIILGKEIHKDIAQRWQEIMAKGLQKESKDLLLQEYPVPANCSLLLAPLLNPEIKAAISDNLAKRDFYMLQKQKQTGIALAALSQAMELLISEKSPKDVFKPLSDACRLLCDVLYNDTRSRRNLIISGINSEMKQTISETVRDKYLFGENIADKLKSAKTIQKSVAELKQPQKSVTAKNIFSAKKPQYDRNRLNWKPPLHQKFTKQDAGKTRQVPRSPKTTSRRTTSDRSPSHKRTRRR